MDSSILNTNNNRGLQLRSGRFVKTVQCKATDFSNSDMAGRSRSNAMDQCSGVNLNEAEQEGDRIITTVDAVEEEETFPGVDEYESDVDNEPMTPPPVKKVKGNNLGTFILVPQSDSFLASNNESYSLINVDNSPDPEISFKSKKVNKTTPTDFQTLRGDPAFETFIKKLVAKEVQQSGKDTAPLRHKSPLDRLGKKVPNNDKNITTPRKGIAINSERIKSPSDTTIYAPAVSMFTDKDGAQLAMDNILASGMNSRQVQANWGVPHSVTVSSPQMNVFPDRDEGTQQSESHVIATNGMVGCTTTKDNNRITDDVAKFIEGIRLQTSLSHIPGDKEATLQPQPGTSKQIGGGNQVDDAAEIAKERAANLILEAERYKATVNAPPGMCNGNQLLNSVGEPSVILNEGLLNNQEPVVTLDDDEFFHVTCHIDASLRDKIEHGLYVDLEKLLPKHRGSGSDDTEMKLVFREGKSYFVPVQGAARINSVRRWEQAFRIYAAIYSQANPSRAAEIWQYVHVINVAAGSYMWDNVSNYDITFRHLMSQNPKRSWSKIYNQMWNLSMRHVLPRNPHNNGNGLHYDPQRRYSSGTGSGSTGGNNANNSASGGQRKPKYCWAFNRGNCKDGLKCKFVNRCSYCDSSEHAKNICPKNTNK